MRTIRIYQDKPLAIQDSFALDSVSCHHLLKVLKIKPNQELVLFNGDGFEYPTQINDITKNNINIMITNKNNINNEPNNHLHLGQSLCKGNKMELIIQKAVELGAAEITPIISEHTDFKISKDKITKKLQHWHNIIIAACSQSGRNIIPKIHPPMQFTAFCQNQANIDNIKLILEPTAKNHIRSIAFNNNNIIALIGPEGGFSSEEIAMATAQHNFQAINIGPRILRTETAGLAILSILQLHHPNLADHSH